MNEAKLTKHIEVACPHCHKRLQILVAHAGKRGTCSGCGGEILVPDAPMDQDPLVPLDLEPDYQVEWDEESESLFKKPRPKTKPGTASGETGKKDTPLMRRMLGTIVPKNKAKEKG